MTPAQKALRGEGAKALERRFSVLWTQHTRGVSGLDVPGPQEQYVFARPRQYRFDFAWPRVKVAAEVEGGIFLQLSDGGKSRHTFPTGFMEDCRKYNLAASLGWLVFRFPGPFLNQRSPDLAQLGLVERAIIARCEQQGIVLGDLEREGQACLI